MKKKLFMSLVLISTSLSAFSHGFQGQFQNVPSVVNEFVRETHSGF
jgi:hypothetical protein